MSYNQENKENEKNMINRNSNKENSDYNTITEVINAFKYFDNRNNGKVDINNLKYYLSQFGNKMNEDEINNIFKKANIDLNNNKELDYIQMINFYKDK